MKLTNENITDSISKIEKAFPDHLKTRLMAEEILLNFRLPGGKLTIAVLLALVYGIQRRHEHSRSAAGPDRSADPRTDDRLPENTGRDHRYIYTFVYRTGTAG